MYSAILFCVILLIRNWEKSHNKTLDLNSKWVLQEFGLHQKAGMCFLWRLEPTVPRCVKLNSWVFLQFSLRKLRQDSLCPEGWQGSSSMSAVILLYGQCRQSPAFCTASRTLKPWINFNRINGRKGACCWVLDWAYFQKRPFASDISFESWRLLVCDELDISLLPFNSVFISILCCGLMPGHN